MPSQQELLQRKKELLLQKKALLAKKSTAKEDYGYVDAAVDVVTEPYNLIPAIGEGINTLTFGATEGVAESFTSGQQRPLIGATQQVYSEDAPEQDKLAKMAKTNEDKISERGFLTGDVPAFLGESSTYAVGAAMLPVGAAASVVPKLKKFKDMMMATKKGKALVAAGTLGAEGAIAEKVQPLTGETKEIRQKQEESKDPLTAGLISGTIGLGTPTLAKAFKRGAELIASTGVVGSKAAQEAARLDMTRQFRKMVDKTINAQRTLEKRAPYDYDEVLNTLDTAVTELDDFNKAAGTQIHISAVDLAESPELVAFLNRYAGDGAADLFAKITGERNRDAIAKLINDSTEKAKNYDLIVAAADDLLKTKTGGENALTRKALSATEGVAGDLVDMDSSLGISRQASTEVRRQYAKELADVNMQYGAIDKAMAGKKISPITLNTEIKDFLSQFSGEEKKRVMAAIPRGMMESVNKKIPLAWEDLEIFKKDVQKAIDSSVAPSGKSTDIYSPKVREFIDGTLKKNVIRVTGREDLVKAKDSADAAYKALKDRERVFTTDELGKEVIATSAAPTVKTAQTLSTGKEIVDEKWLQDVTSNKSRLESTLEAYPAQVGNVENYVMSRLAEKADETGKVSQSKLAAFLKEPDIADILTSDKVSGLKSRLGALTEEAATSGRADIATSFADKLTGATSQDMAFIDRLWGSAKNDANLRGMITKMAKESGTDSNLRNAMRDSLKRKLLSDTGGDITLINKALAEKLSNEKSVERAIYKEIFGADIDTTLRGLALLKKSDMLDKFNKVAEQVSGGAARPAAEAGVIAGLGVTPYIITRLSALFARLGPDAKSRVALEIATSPDAMKKFIQTASKPDKENLTSLINTIESLTATGVSDKVPEYEANTNDEIPQPEFPYGGSSSGDITQPTLGDDIPTPDYPYGETSGKAPEGVAPATEVRPQTKLEYLAPKQQQVVELAQKSAARAKVDQKGFVNTLAIESNLGQDTTNPSSNATGVGQIMPDTWRGFVKKYGTTAGVTESMINNPEANIKLAAFVYKDAINDVKKVIGKNPTDVEAYIGYKLGGPNSRVFFDLLQNNPKAIPAKYIVAAATSNPQFFYEDGTTKSRPLTVAEVKQRYVKRYAEKKVV